MAKELAYVKSIGTVSDTHYSHDHLNAQKTMPIDEKVFQMWKDRFREIESRAKCGSGEKIQWVIVDGFLLYWSPVSLPYAGVFDIFRYCAAANTTPVLGIFMLFQEVYDELDVRLLLREPEPRVRARRLARSGYHTADGSLWRDPPNYWEQIVWPSYVRAHQGIFEGGDVEHGESNGKVRDLVVLHGETLTMTELFEKACEKIIESL
ncbi:ribosylnicotinamide kinase [Tulasnella sp. JGI-2019a]|nr:ribosylnicotinamide kinase [Tulasnella sp. JGI-2019a]